MAGHLNGTSPHYDVSILELPNSPANSSPVAYGVNDLGQIAGHIGNHGFIDNHGTVTSVFVPFAGNTTALGINNLGQVVGEFTNSAGGHPFIDTNGTITYIDLPPAYITDAKATSINDLGQVVGQYTAYAATTPDTISASFGFIENNGTVTKLTLSDGMNFMPNSINDFDQVAGTTAAGVGGVLDLKTDEFTPVSVVGAESTTVNSINNLGQVAGWYTDHSGDIHGFVDTRGVFSKFNLPPSVPGSLQLVNSINDFGQLVGDFISAGTTESFIATPRAADRSLSDLLSSLPASLTSGLPSSGGFLINPGAAPWSLESAVGGVSLPAPLRFGEI